MTHSALASPILFVLGVACTTPGPAKTLDDYEEAIAQHDWARVRELSDRGTRAAYAPDEFRREAEQTDLSTLKVRLDAPQRIGERHVVLLRDGPPVILVLEEDGWRVEQGGLALARTDTPAGALRTLFRAVREDRLDLLRLVIPKRHAAQLESDAALLAALEALRPRALAAAEALDGMALQPVIEGAAARVTYGPGRTVRLVLEDGRWRVLDVE